MGNWVIYLKWVFFRMVSRWVRSEWADVRPPHRFLRAIPASRVPPCQTLCTRRLCGSRSGGGWSNTGWGCQGNVVCPQRGETLLSPGMQVHTTADQLLSPVAEEMREQREVWDHFASPSAYRAAEEMWRLGSALCPSHSRRHADTTRVCPSLSKDCRAAELIWYSWG